MRHVVALNFVYICGEALKTNIDIHSKQDWGIKGFQKQSFFSIILFEAAWNLGWTKKMELMVPFNLCSSSFCRQWTTASLGL